MADSQLITLAGQWAKQGKFRIGYINDVHNIIIKSPTVGNFGLLQHCQYFDLVLWKYFESDCSNNHIELVVMSLLSDEIDQQTFNLVDDSRFNVLILRCLHITYDIRIESNFRLHRLILQLLGLLLQQGLLTDLFDVLVSRANELTHEDYGPHKIIRSWYINLLKKTTEFLYTINTSEFIEYVKLVILFCHKLQLRYSREILNVEYAYRYNIELFPEINVFLGKLITPDSSYFKNLQNNQMEGLRDDTGKVAFLNKYTNYGVTVEETKHFLLLFSKAQLYQIGDLSEDVSQDMLVNIITLKILGADYFEPLWDQNIIDRFDRLDGFTWLLPQEDQYFIFKKYIYEHVVQVLTRVEPSLDKSNNFVINGKSKYFHKVTDKNVGVITVDDLRVDDVNYVILIQLKKPNKYSSVRRIKRFGLHDVTFRKVFLEKGSDLVLRLKDYSEFTANYMIPLPNSRESRLFQYHNSDSRFGNTGDLLSNPIVQLYGPEANSPEDSGRKRLKKDDNIFSSIGNDKLIKIETPPYSLAPMLNKILETLNSRNQTAMIIVPNMNYDNIPINKPIQHLVSNSKQTVLEIKLILLKELQELSGVEAEELELITAVRNQWNNFLRRNKDNKGMYPFGKRNQEDANKAYLEIQQKYDFLKGLNGSLPKRFLQHSLFKFTIFTEDDILAGRSKTRYDHIIVIDSHLILLKLSNLINSLQGLLILFGNPVKKESLYSLNGKYFKLKECHTHPELFDYYKTPELELIPETSDLKYPIQVIQVIPVVKSETSLRQPETKPLNNIAEAEYCVALYKYLNKTYDVGLVSLNEYQSALLKEMTSIKIENQALYGHDYLVVSTYGYKTIGDIMTMINKAKKGVMFVGEVCEPFKCHIGPFEILKNGKYIKVYNINQLK